MKRVLVVILALLIGSPVCWCCVSHGAPSVIEADACPMCGDSEPAPSDETCPCEHGFAAREMTQPDVALRVTTETWLPDFAWVRDFSDFRISAVFGREGKGLIRETGPPVPGRPLYRLHCAMLN
jgi:hypothetical protein